ncbi:uncharacterized protein CXorf38 homolog [Mercenaria mercenaria]|uniref:uncharacterized protein CXorf38 homolog n=1 Tax=Mercenaria mercenaria TaxID=6596 RepID=UPI00234E7805|nr:uncharacterized protein CXorf38 homolog [Mercenaria mercenaria]
MDHRAQLENKKYRNWVRARLGIKYVKDGLAPFCDHLVTQQHVDILDKVKQKHNLSAVSCGLCDVRTLQPDHVQTKNRQCPLGQTHCNCLHPRGKTSCPNNVCGAIYDEIIRRHASTPPVPYWRNTDAHQWCTEPWAVAKCFINAPGYEHKLRATEFDCSGLLHLLIDNLKFHHHIQSVISGNDAFSRVLQHRNAIFHCNNMEVEDTDIANYIDDMIELLQDDKEIKDRQESKNAVKKLLELKQEKFVITTTDELEVRRIAMDAIEEKEKNLEQRIVDASNEIGVKTDESKTQIKEIGSTIKDELAQKRVDMKDDLRKTEIDLIGKLQKREKEIKEAIRMKEIESTETMDKKEMEIKDNLRMVELGSKGKLDQKGKEIEKHLERKGEDILNQLERKQSAQIQIEAKRNDDITKATEDDLMKSSPRDRVLQSNYERMRAGYVIYAVEKIHIRRERSSSPI